MLTNGAGRTVEIRGMCMHQPPRTKSFSSMACGRSTIWPSRGGCHPLDWDACTAIPKPHRPLVAIRNGSLVSHLAWGDLVLFLNRTGSETCHNTLPSVLRRC